MIACSRPNATSFRSNLWNQVDPKWFTIELKWDYIFELAWLWSSRLQRWIPEMRSCLVVWTVACLTIYQTKASGSRQLILDMSCCKRYFPNVFEKFFSTTLSTFRIITSGKLMFSLLMQSGTKMLDFRYHFWLFLVKRNDRIHLRLLYRHFEKL